MQLYLVRHGQSVGNAEGNVQGQDPSVDGGLSDLGRQQAQMAAARMAAVGLTHLYCSPLPRARETAGIIGQACGVDPIEQGWLVEVSYGELEGRPQTETTRLYPGVYDPHWRQENVIPGGEPFPQACARARDGIAGLLAAHVEDDVVCIVSHGEFLSKMIDSMLNAPEIGFPQYMVDNASITRMIRYPSSGGGVWICRCVGDTRHLQELNSPAGRNGW